MPFKRRDEPTTIEDEREALRAQHAALEDLKQQLAERVAAVRERELELHHALAETASREPVISTGKPTHHERPDPSAGTRAGTDVHAVARREEALLERERVAAQLESRLQQREQELERRAAQAPASPPVEPDAARLAQIETRLKELREAEKLFLRTREELADRSEALAARERLVSQKERELDEREDGADRSAGPALSEVEARLRRLELQQQQPGGQTLGFSGGLRKLQQGTKRPQQGD